MKINPSHHHNALSRRAKVGIITYPKDLKDR